MPVPHDIAAETELWDAYAESAFKDDAEPSFCWTQYAGHGPGPELLGSPKSVLEIGCGTGHALAHLAQQGVKVTGVDLSPRMAALASAKWAPLGVRIERAEILDWLAADGGRYDAVYSIFGAAWFTDPSRLFPLVRKRLVPGGVFVFSQPPAIPGAYGPQGMYKGGFAGKAMSTYRYSYKPAVWERHLLRAGFTFAEATVVDAPKAGHIGSSSSRPAPDGRVTAPPGILRSRPGPLQAGLRRPNSTVSTARLENRTRSANAALRWSKMSSPGSARFRRVLTRRRRPTDVSPPPRTALVPLHVPGFRECLLSAHM